MPRTLVHLKRRPLVPPNPVPLGDAGFPPHDLERRTVGIREVVEQPRPHVDHLSVERSLGIEAAMHLPERFEACRVQGEGIDATSLEHRPRLGKIDPIDLEEV